jgi:hypothetical protein
MPPSIGDDGTVFVECYYTLYALNPDDLAGTAKWTRPFPTIMMGTPVVGPNQRLYLPYGKPLGMTDTCWKYAALDAQTGDTIWESSETFASTDFLRQGYYAGNGVVVVTVEVGDAGGSKIKYAVHAFSDDGDSARHLWVKEYDASAGTLAFGPGATVWTNNAAPNLPADGARDLGTTVTLSWTCSDPEGQGLKYDIFVGDATTTMVPLATGITATSYQVDGLAAGTAYIWKVIATDGQAIAEGPTWGFATVAASPSTTSTSATSSTTTDSSSTTTSTTTTQTSTTTTSVVRRK